MQEADNNYAPPKAHVADLERPQPPPPREIRVAVFLLYTSLVMTATAVFQINAFPLLQSAVFGCALLIAWGLAYFVGKRSKVARGALLAIVLLAVAGTVFNVFMHVHPPTMIIRPIGWANLTVRVIAVCLVYTRPANAWFRGESSSTHN
jgi:hypothetical protein